MKILLACAIAVTLLAWMTVAASAQQSNSGIAKAIPAVVKSVAHPSLTTHHMPRIGQISTLPTGSPVVILPGAPSTSPSDKATGEMPNGLRYDF